MTQQHTTHAIENTLRDGDGWLTQAAIDRFCISHGIEFTPPEGYQFTAENYGPDDVECNLAELTMLRRGALIDVGFSAIELEALVGEGWTIESIYLQAHVDGFFDA